MATMDEPAPDYVYGDWLRVRQPDTTHILVECGSTPFQRVDFIKPAEWFVLSTDDRVINCADIVDVRRRRR